MKRLQAFSLVELLIAVAVTSILVVLLTSAVGAALAVWQQGRGRIDVSSTTRQVLQRITDELTGVVAIRDRAQFVENVSSLSSAGGFPTEGIAENVFFIAPIPNLRNGDLCVVAYRLNSDSLELQRGFLDSEQSWGAGGAPRYMAASYETSALNWRTVATGIVEFELRAYSQQALDTNAPHTPTWNSQTNGAGPRRLKVRLRAVDEAALARLRTFQRGSSAYNRTLQESAREFSADIALSSQ